MSRKLLARFAAAAVAMLMGVGALAGFGSADDADVNEEAGATWSFRIDPGDDDDDDGWGPITLGATWS